MSAAVQEFRYDDAIVRKFLWATIIWGVVGMLVGLFVAVQLVWPGANLGEWLTFGRLRPLHTNAVIFAFAGNGIFCAVYYSSQRLLKARMFSDLLSAVHFWGWQLIIVAAAITLPLGITQSKEYAELEWPIDLAIAAVWVIFAINFFGTVARRRERHLYVALWFYIATIVTVALLHIFNNLVVPAGLWRSYSIYAGAQDAFMQWWYGHNAVAFFLTTPFLGLMYYFLPKAADRPVFSYKLSILHFWTIVFLYIWAGPHHLHYTAIPAWASTLGMLFSVMLWMPSWGGMINGLLTLRGAWHKVAEDPILKFYVVAITFYGMSTFEGPMMSVKSVNMLSHYTDWNIAHVHGGGLGWVGFMVFGMVYWLAPRLFQTQIWSAGLRNVHFWLGTLGILLYIIPIYVAGITQGLMWSDFDSDGGLKYASFVETTVKLIPMYAVRILGGLLYFSGTVLCLVNLVMTWSRRPASYDVPVQSAPPLSSDYVDPPRQPSPLEQGEGHFPRFAYRLDRFFHGTFHRRWERLPLFFTVMVILSVLVATLFEAIPTFVLKSNIPTIKTVKPYTPLELAGRDLYISNGCYNCHSQMIRPLWAENVRYGEYSKPGEFVYDHPFQWGSRRIGPDLAREGGSNLRKSHDWHYLHMRDPRELVEGSIMPAYPFMLEQDLDFAEVEKTVRAMATLHPTEFDSDRPSSYVEVLEQGVERHARSQAHGIASELVAALQDDELTVEGLEARKIIAMIAYLQRLGTDLTRTEASEPAGAEGAGGGR